MAYNKDLKHTLSVFTEIKTVWFNEDGVWSFHAREGFDIQVKSDDVINDIEPNTELVDEYEDMTIPQLKEELTSRNIRFAAGAGKPALLALIRNNN